jgi:hypothetical protein
MSEIDIPDLDINDQTDEENADASNAMSNTMSNTMIDPFDPSQINIQPEQHTLHNIVERLRNDEIDMNTDFQRHADLWTPDKMSRLIESILIRLPLPAFYFDATDDNKWLIVDGLQRLSSIRQFVIQGNLRLSNLEYLIELNGKSYTDLERHYQRRIDECPISLFKILPGTPANVKYSIFQRMNTGGLVLNNQEIRNAMARPRERAFLERLAKDDNLILTMGNQSKRMLDQEMALRFIAFFTQDYHTSRKSIISFLDATMENLKSSPQSTLDALEKQFKRAISYCFQIFGSAAFDEKIIL